MKRSILAASIIVLSATVGFGQSAPERATILRKLYENCVYDAVGDQWKRAPKINPNLATETAFQMCGTEEQAIISLLYSIGITPADAGVSISGIKLDLKRTVREIMTDPAGYARRHGAK